MVNYIPVLTTVFSVFFLSRIVPHYLVKRPPYLLWWMLGVLTFGLGTLTESINAIFGWTEWNTKIWYIVGALLGGYPLAQGTIYLLMKKRFADMSALVCSAVILVAAVCVLSSPIEIPEGFDYRLTGRVFAWQWVRAFSPLLNLYAFVFLFGGAVYSAIVYLLGKDKANAPFLKVRSLLPSSIILSIIVWIVLFTFIALYLAIRYISLFGIGVYSAVRYGKRGGGPRFLGNTLIAIGALLPGIGGTFTRFGYVEVLYITEFIGLTFIYFGYDMMRKDRSASLHANQQTWGGPLPADPRAT
ncbi:MAG TPA: hypothetical protein VKP67_11900 [Xanthobacteraceae bacterium]|nr:hypothetical protein [Xanthobacteraceae bacterium]